MRGTNIGVLQKKEDHMKRPVIIFAILAAILLLLAHSLGSAQGKKTPLHARHHDRVAGIMHFQ
jgi:hypothetical protein